MIISRQAIAILAVSALAGCGGSNPFFVAGTGDDDTATVDPTPVTPTPTISPAVPDNILNDVESFAYDPTTDTFTVEGLTQDGVPVASDYTRVATSFVAGYETYTAQNDPLGRHVTAFVASRDGVRAGVMMTGGQFNRIFGGSYYERDAVFDPIEVLDPDGDVSYFGEYVGLINGPGPENNLLPVTSTGPDAPNTAAYVEGMVFINVDFADMAIEGEIFDRVAQFDDGSSGATPLALPDIILINTTFTDDGSFAGDIEVEGEIDQTIGAYSGIFAGTDSAHVAGGISIQEFTDDLENEIEYGVFLIDVCDASRTEPQCVDSL